MNIAEIIKAVTQDYLDQARAQTKAMERCSDVQASQFNMIAMAD